MTYQDFIIAAQQKFPGKFEYLEESFVDDKTPMTMSFRNIKFKISPYSHIKSDTGFPKIIFYELFIEIAKDALKDEFFDYEFKKENFKKYSRLMRLKYKGKECSMSPLDVIRSSRNSEEYQNAKEIALRYSRPEEMNKDFPKLYNKIKTYHWNELISHFNMRPKGYTNEYINEFIEKCIKENLTRNEVKLKYPKEAEFIRDNRLTKLFLLLPVKKDEIISTYKETYGIYAYEFILPEGKFAYIGLTSDFTQRAGNHKSKNAQKLTTVRKFADKHGVNIPEMKIIKDYEPAMQAIIDEGLVQKEYEETGWTTINIQPTGGLGAPHHRHKYDPNEYSEEECRRIIKELGIIQRWQVRECVPNMARWLSKNKMWDVLFPPLYFSKEDCIEIARKYNGSTLEWKSQDFQSYSWAQRRGWAKEIRLLTKPYLALCSRFDKNVIYCVFSEYPDIFSFFKNELKRISSKTTFVNSADFPFIIKEITYEKYNSLLYINVKNDYSKMKLIYDEVKDFMINSEALLDERIIKSLSFGVRLN